MILAGDVVDGLLDHGRGVTGERERDTADRDQRQRAGHGAGDPAASGERQGGDLPESVVGRFE